MKTTTTTTVPPGESMSPFELKNKILRNELAIIRLQLYTFAQSFHHMNVATTPDMAAKLKDSVVSTAFSIANGMAPVNELVDRFPLVEALFREPLAPRTIEQVMENPSEDLQMTARVYTEWTYHQLYDMSIYKAYYLHLNRIARDEMIVSKLTRIIDRQQGSMVPEIAFNVEYSKSKLLLAAKRINESRHFVAFQERDIRRIRREQYEEFEFRLKNGMDLFDFEEGADDSLVHDILNTTSSSV